MVSVAIPVYNQQRYITETLLSALNQKTDFDYEIVVGDDCSTDDTRSILADFKQKYPQKINIIYNEKNIGSLLNEKSVLDHCKGKYIALLDGDDLFFNEKKLQRQYDFLENNPQYGVVHSDARLLIEDELSESKVFDSINDYFHREIKVGDVFEELLLRYYITACTVFFQRDLHIKHSDFDAWSKLGFLMPDVPMLLEFSKFSKIAYIKESLSVYRLLPGSISHPNNKYKKLRFLLSVAKVNLYFSEKYGVSDAVRKEMLNNNFCLNLECLLHFKDKEVKEKVIEHFNCNKPHSALISLYYWAGKSVAGSFLFKVFRKISKLLNIDLYIF